MKDEIIIDNDDEEITFYTAKYDRSFKEIFLKEANQDLLTKLLEFVLQVKINSITYLNVERNQGNVKVRRKTLDVLLETDHGLIGIEVNSSYKSYLHPRNFAFLCDVYAHYTFVGDEYSEDVQIIQINFSYDIGNKDDKLLRIYNFQDETGVKYVNNIVCYDFNMDNIMKFWYSKDEKMINEYKYLIMLDLEPEDLKRLSKDRLVGKFMEDLENLNKDPKFREYMSVEEDLRKCHNSDLRIAREEGIEEGAKEANIKTAKNFLKLGILTDEQIAIGTNLTIEEVEELKKDLNKNN